MPQRRRGRACWQAQEMPFDVVIDLGLPHVDADLVNNCAEGKKIPILNMTARSLAGRVEGLERCRRLR